MQAEIEAPENINDWVLSLQGIGKERLPSKDESNVPITCSPCKIQVPQESAAFNFENFIRDQLNKTMPNKKEDQARYIVEDVEDSSDDDESSSENAEDCSSSDTSGCLSKDSSDDESQEKAQGGDLAESASEHDAEDEDNAEPEETVGARKGSKDIWLAANRSPIMPSLESIYQKCNSSCHLSGNCAENISGKHIIKLRKEFLGEDMKNAPKDKERASRILKYIKNAREDKKNNLIFNIGGNDVCTPTFLRFLGVMGSVNMRDAPGQWTRLIRKYLAGEADDDNLIKKEELKLDRNEGFASKEAHCIAFINEYCLLFSDAIPLASSEDDDGNIIETMVAPFETITDFFAEYNFHCDTANPPISIIDRAKYGVFKNAWNKLHKLKTVKFMGGKSGFPVCPTCVSITGIKKTACCKRDTITRDVLKKLARLHLKQQATERQHAENFIYLCKKMHEGKPDLAYIDIDPQSVWTGNTPKLQKLNVKQSTHIENRNIGVHIVCGPIDEYISVCTNNLIPGGANVLIETLRFAMEYLGRRLGEFGLILPKKVGIQFDNSGENKVLTF
jgi:hypothetical protein